MFGDRDRYMPYAVNGFFENGGLRNVRLPGGGRKRHASKTGAGKIRGPARRSGSWGKRIWVKVSESSTKRKVDGAMVSVGFRLQVAYWATWPDGFVAFDPFDQIANRGKLPRPTVVEDFDDLVIDPTSPDFYPKRLVDNSALVTLTGPDTDDTTLPDFNDGAMLDNGVDDPQPAGVDDFKGDPVPGQRDEPQGLNALRLDPYREVALVYAPFHPTDAGPHLRVKSSPIVRLTPFPLCRHRLGSRATSAISMRVDPRTNLTDSSYAAF